MNEEIILYGKNNPDIVPELSVWGFPISLYLFLGGMAAGILFVTSVNYLFRRQKIVTGGTLWASQISFVALLIGTGALLFDLHRISSVWRLYTHFDLQAPMSWGAWTLLVILPLNLLWASPFNIRLMKKWKIKSWIERQAENFRGGIAVLLMGLSILLGIYTGMLLSAFSARPLWDSSFLPVLFLLSGLSSGTAILIWLTSDIKLNYRIRKMDMAIISLEVLFLFFYIVQLYSGSPAQVAAIGELIAGRFAFYFWVLVVFVGLIIPVFFEWRELRGSQIPLYAVPVLILIGSLALRVLLVEAGQMLTS